MSQKNRQRIMLALVLVLLLCLALLLGGRRGAEPATKGNLLENGDFTAVTDGMPDDWTTGM